LPPGVVKVAHFEGLALCGFEEQDAVTMLRCRTRVTFIENTYYWSTIGLINSSAAGGSSQQESGVHGL